MKIESVALCFVLCIPLSLRADDSAPEPVTSRVWFDLGEPVAGAQKISGKGGYVVQQGFSIVSMEIWVAPSKGGLVQTEKAKFKDGKWSVTLLQVSPGTYNAHMLMKIKNDANGKTTEIGSPFKFDLKVNQR